MLIIGIKFSEINLKITYSTKNENNIIAKTNIMKYDRHNVNIISQGFAFSGYYIQNTMLNQK